MSEDKNLAPAPAPAPTPPAAPPDMWRAREACRLWGLWNGPRPAEANRPPYSLMS
jgi:hypothetical protein